MLIVEVESKWPQMCVDRVLYMQTYASDHAMHEKNALEKIQQDFKQIFYAVCWNCLQVQGLWKCSFRPSCYSVYFTCLHLLKAWSLQSDGTAE